MILLTCPSCGYQEEKRSLSQNALLQVWYDMADKESGYGRKYEERSAKINFGLPILELRLGDNPLMQKFATMTYEQQMHGIDLVRVSSAFTKKEMNQYLKELHEHYLGRGIKVEFPDECR